MNFCPKYMRIIFVIYITNIIRIFFPALLHLYTKYNIKVLELYFMCTQIVMLETYIPRQNCENNFVRILNTSR